MRRSLALNATDIVYVNRALAYLRLSKYADALADGNCALALEPRSWKAWMRKSAAHKLLGKPVQALDDVEQALRYCFSKSPIVMRSHVCITMSGQIHQGFRGGMQVRNASLQNSSCMLS